MLTLLLFVWLGVVPQNTSIVQGQVKRGDVSQALEGVEISLIRSDNQARLRTISDAQGRFVFENIPLGKYTVMAAREGYFTYPQGQSLPSVVWSLAVDSPQTRQLTIDLVPGAIFSGRITDPQGRPLSGVQVSATKLQYDEGRPAFAIGSLPRTTNDQGEYRLFWFPPGEYYIRAEYPLGENNLARRSYYPGTLDSAMAVPLTVHGGESFDGMNFAIPSATSIRISGQVAFDSPGPATGTVRTFYLLPRDGRPIESTPAEFVNTIPPQARRQRSPDFSLDVRGLPPGSYDLAPFYIELDSTYRSGRTRIEIADQDIENVTAVLSPNVDVTGRFLFEGDRAAFQNWNLFRLQLRSKDVAIPLMTRSSLATVGGDGTFVIRNVPEGVYNVYLGAAAGTIATDFYISGMRQGALDIRNEGIIDVRASMLPLEITVSSGAGLIHGIVEAPDGSTPPRADVVLVPQISRRANAMFYDRTITDDKGQFTFAGIPPGEYKVFAFEQLADTAERNSAFIARYETLGISVSVNPRATTEVRARLLR